MPTFTALSHSRMLTTKALLISIFFCISTNLLAEPLRIAVASNFTSPIKKLVPIFEKETGEKVQLSFGSSGKFYAQITHGAPFDVFLSADQSKPNKLIKAGLAQSQSKVIYAKGALALWSAKLKTVKPVKATLTNANKIAIANPKLAPYGKAAQETLIKMGLWKQLQSKLVEGENIGQTYQFAYSQNADVGFVALSQALSGHIKGSYWVVPNDDHTPIKQAAVILTRTKETRNAQNFLNFLMRPEIQADIARFGYITSSHN